MKFDYQKKVCLSLFLGLWCCLEARTSYEEKVRVEGIEAQKLQELHEKERKKIENITKNISQTKAQIKGALTAQKNAKTEQAANAENIKLYALREKLEQQEAQLDALTEKEEQFTISKSQKK